MANLKFDFAPDTYAVASEINQNFQRIEQQDVFNENLSSQVNGVTKTFSTANPILSGTLRVYVDGIRITPTDDFIEGPNGFTLSAPWPSPEIGVPILVDYRIKY